MTRDEAIALYRPVRAAIQRVLKRAQASCSKADFMRSARLLGLKVRGTIMLDSDQETAMLADVALFEPNRRGSRAFDRFLRTGADGLGPSDRAVAERMAGAFFSIFRVAGRHEAAGVWLEDLLGGRDRGRLWLMDESFEVSAAEGGLIAGRLFDAGPFHAAFGILSTVDGETAEELCATIGEATTVRPSLGPHLVPMLYGLQIHSSALAEFIAEDPLMMALLADDPSSIQGLLGEDNDRGGDAAAPGGPVRLEGSALPRRRGAARSVRRKSGGR